MKQPENPKTRQQAIDEVIERIYQELNRTAMPAGRAHNLTVFIRALVEGLFILEDQKKQGVTNIEKGSL